MGDRIVFSPQWIERLQAWRGRLQQGKGLLSAVAGARLDPGEWARLSALPAHNGGFAPPRGIEGGESAGLAIVGPFDLPEPAGSLRSSSGGEQLQFALQSSGLAVWPLDQVQLPNMGVAAPLRAWAVHGASTAQLDEWMLAFDQAAVLMMRPGKPSEFRWHPHSSACLENGAAERATCRLWVRALDLGQPAVIAPLLTEETLYVSEWYGAPLEGRNSILTHLQSCLSIHRTLGETHKEGGNERRALADCAIAKHRSGGREQACVRMFEGNAAQPSALVIPTLDKGRIRVLTLCIPTNYQIVSLESQPSSA